MIVKPPIIALGQGMRSFYLYTSGGYFEDAHLTSKGMVADTCIRC